MRRIAAAVLAAGALLGSAGCASPAVDPIERLGRRAVDPGGGERADAAGTGAAGAPGREGARAPVRNPASPAPTPSGAAPAFPAFPAPAEAAGRLLDRL
ncbi:hypothetical protein [Streptomyces sp. NPDC058953]|uniref:hypothetical protein n=1 Tax=unclassified Streptomyces TaxID=2593676 RepID=UPI0036C0ABF5